MLAYRSLAARCNLLSRPLCAPPIAPSLSRPRCFQGSIHQNNFPSFVAMERSQDASNNAAKHKTKRSPMRRWRPISTEAAPKGANLEERSDAESKQVVENYTTSSEHLALGGTTNIDIEVATEAASTSENSFALKSNTAKVVIEETMEEIDIKKDLDRSDTSNKHSSSVEVDAPLIRFLKGKSGSMQKQIEEETGVKIIFPSSKEETCVVLEGNTAESIIKASERIARVLEEAVKSPMLDYSHFISLPLAIHPDLVEKLNNFQSSILRTAASSMDSDKEEEDQEEGTSDEMDYEDKQAEGPSVSVKLRVEKEERVKVKMDTKLSKPDLGIDKSIFIKPKMFHLTVLMLKLWNKDRVARASEVLQSISNQVKEALENRPISIQLRGLTCMKGSPARARVVYAPVLEVGGEGRLERACKVIIDAFAESGLVLEKDSRHELKLHATIMNVRHRKSKKRNRRNDSFDARHIFRVYGQQEWGEYHIPEVHLSQRFKFDENGYYHCCSSIALPEGFQVE